MKLTRDYITSFIGHEVWATNNEIQTFIKYAEKSKNIVEIGCAFGGSTCAFLFGVPADGTVTSIDPFIVDSKGSWQANEYECQRGVNHFLKQHNLLKQWVLLPFFSFNIVKNWSTKIDFLYIDGSHHYEDVKKDFNDWFPFINPGGFVAIHDSQQPDSVSPETFLNGWPGPTKLVKELTHNIVEIVDSLTVLGIQ